MAPAMPVTGEAASFGRPFAVTFFTSYAATEKHQEPYTAASLAQRIRTVTASKKDRLPWLKLATFGDSRTEADALRHDANVLAITGIEADYDTGTMSVDDAVEVATKAGLLCILYTSPSHTEAAPRWRVLCPLSAAMPPDRRDAMMGRLNGLYGGIFAEESWTLSQSYYYGSVKRNPAHRVEVLDGTPLDELDELDRIWRGKPDTKPGSKGSDGTPRTGPMDEAAVLAELVSGKSYHTAAVRLLGRWALNGVPLLDARAKLVEAMEAVPKADRDARWTKRRADLDRCLTSIYGKEAAKQDAAEEAEGAPDGAAAPPPRKPQLQVVQSDLPATARAVRDLLAVGGSFYDRGGVLVKLAHPADGGPPVAIEVTPHGVVCEAHRLCQPMAWSGDSLKPITLPERVAKMYLDQRSDWRVPALDGVTTAPVLAGDGTILDRDGYDASSRLWCARVPALVLPDRPTRQEAEAALMKLRKALRTFPFGDSSRVTITQADGSTLSVVDTDKPAGLDETAALAALLTAVCRPSLHLAPGFLVSAAAISGAGAGKGLLVRAICLTAFGTPPRAFTAGTEKGELDKRLVAELIEATPALFLDNVNGASLKSDLLASVLTERPARVRILGKSLMVPLNSTAFISLTGNGLSVSEDLARRFLSCNLDAQCEDPESRPFAPGYLDRIAAARPALLAAALTIWRWGRQNPGELTRGLRLGSFETWAEWVRDPLLTLGCADPVKRIQDAKASDPRRKQVFELFTTWWDQNGNAGRQAKDLSDDVKAIADPAGRGRQYLATYLDKLTGTRAAGFVLLQHKPTGKWSTTTYSLKVADQVVVDARAVERRAAEAEQPDPPPDDAQEPSYWPE